MQTFAEKPLLKNSMKKISKIWIFDVNICEMSISRKKMKFYSKRTLQLAYSILNR